MSAKTEKHPERCQHGKDWATCRACIETLACGCCGSDEDVRGYWCRRCEGHVLTHGAPHNRTYYAQHSQDCPWQLK